MSGRHEGGRQGTVPECPHVPDRPVRRRGGELRPAVLRCTEADWGNPAHPAPACSCCLHPAAGGSASVYSSSRAAPCHRPRSHAADAAASSQAAQWSRPQGSHPARPGPRQTRRQASKQAALRRTTQGWRCLLFGRWWTHLSLPRRRAGRRIFCFLFCHWPHGQWYPKPRQKSSFLYLWVPRGDGGLWTSQTWVTLTLLSRQWTAVGGSRGRSIALLCRNAGKCVTHADPASDRQRDARAGSLRSPSLPHRGYVSGFVGVTSTVLVGLASAPQPVSLAPPYHQTRLCDSVRPATSQVSRHPLHHSEGGADAPILRAEIAVLLAKDAIEPVPSADMRSGFYSPYFIVPKKSGGLRPILDLRVLNRVLHRLPFKMLTPKRIFGCVRPQDWFAAIDLKDAYFHVSILPRHRPFLRFAFEGRAYQYKVLPFGLSLSPRVFTKVAERLAYGGCGGGHAAGAAPYETASTLAPWPSPEVGVAERHAEGPSHSSLPPNLHPVVRPFISSGRSAPGTGLQAHCGLHRHLRQGLGGHVQRACSVGGLDGSPTALAHQLPRVAGSTPGLEPSQETLTRRACTSPYGQHCDRCVHQPTRWSTLPSHVTTRPPPPPLESEASEVASRHSYPGLAQPHSRRAVTSCAPRRMETPSPDGPADLATFWTRTGRPVRVPRDVALPVVLLPDRSNTRHGRTGTQLATGPSQICISPSEPSRTDSVQGQRGRGADPARGTILAYQDLVPRADAPRDSPSMADSSEEGSTDSETGHLMAPASRPLETSCLVPRRDAEVLDDLPQEVVDTITSARAPSTRHAYALKWNLFVEWCSSHREDPRRCPIRVVLSFLQQGLERRLSPSTLKVYVAAIAANHDPVEGKSVGKHDWVVRFLRGARRLNPPRPPSIPSWDLSLVLRALQQGPFEPLQTVEPKFLSMKTLLLLALASIKRVGDLHAFSVDDSCLQFGPADSQMILRPRAGYVPKVPTTPFRDQVVSLQALPPEEADPALALLCPVRALRHYVDRTQSFRTSDQLFVCHRGRQKGNAVSKQRMAHWIVDAITLAYQAQGVPCPFRLRAHSTRSVASSWALARGASLTDICRAAGWATPNTFARFYSLRVEPVSSCVLTSNG